jgi:predicted HD superfamily hydrolase involved in NAD metabolism
MWNKQELLLKTEQQVNQKRFTHILGVIETAVKLATQVGADPEKAEVAAILHDYCKAWSKDRLKEVLLAHNDVNWLEYPAVLWHAPAAVYVARESLGIDDPEILNAIYYHTTGRANMTLLEKVIWIADYIEPNRDFPGVEQARKLADTGLNEALRYGLGQTITHLVEKGFPIYPLTIEAYNYYIKTGGNERS